MAAHVPNCAWLRSSIRPSGGKIKSAMALRIKITPSDTAISFSLAFITPPTAAIALPPQMAVPDEMRYEVRPSIFMYLPSRMPTTITPITETIVKIMPSAPDWSDFWRFMPNPRPTTEAWRRSFENFLLNFGCGMPKIKANAKPMKRATGAEKRSSAWMVDSSVVKSLKGISIRTSNTQ